MEENNFNPRENESKPEAFKIKGQWNPDEDRLLVCLVEQYGMKVWSTIAKLFVGRKGKQCRERWYNHLRPGIKKEAWSVEEEMELVRAHADVGNKWAEIAKRIPGRAENSIKNHWNATKRRQIAKGNNSQSSMNKNKGQHSSVLQDYMRFRALILEKDNGKQNKGAEGNCIPNTLFPSVNEQENFQMMKGNGIFEENDVIFDDINNLAIISSLPSSSSSSYAFSSALENYNMGMEIQEFLN